MNEDDMDDQNGTLLIVPTSDSNIVDAMDELKALTAIMQAMRTVNGDAARSRILAAAASFFKLPSAHQSSSFIAPQLPHGQSSPPLLSRAFSEERPTSPKDFLVLKQPRTDVERVACLAYFLTHYRDTPAFKTIDISKLNTEAAQPKFSNAAMAVDNATKSRYLVPASKGNKQIGATGELFVQALPDRDAAREAMAANLRPRRKRKLVRTDASTTQEDDQ